jgi:hypothetical protein
MVGCLRMAMEIGVLTVMAAGMSSGPHHKSRDLGDGFMHHGPFLDRAKRAVLHEVTLEPEFGQTVRAQAPRIPVQPPDDRISVLSVSGIAQLCPDTCALTLLAGAPRNFHNGGAYPGVRLYFGAGVHVLLVGGASSRVSALSHDPRKTAQSPAAESSDATDFSIVGLPGTREIQR